MTVYKEVAIELYREMDESPSPFRNFLQREYNSGHGIPHLSRFAKFYKLEEFAHVGNHLSNQTNGLANVRIERVDDKNTRDLASNVTSRSNSHIPYRSRLSTIYTGEFMRFQLHSDIHLEAGQYNLTNIGADALILAGDICVANDFGDEKKAARYRQFFDIATSMFDQVIYVLGNHEHYRGDIVKTKSRLESILKYPNLSILDNQFIDIGNVRIIGSTMWTDIESVGPLAVLDCKYGMNDYKQISNSAVQVAYNVIDYAAMGVTPQEYHSTKTYNGEPPKPPIMKKHYKDATLTVKDTSEIHRKSVEFIKSAVKDHDRCIVVTHHAPCYLSIPDEYKYDKHNAAYYTDLSNLIMDNQQIAYWCHGHVHSINNYFLENTNIISNPRGYAYSEVGVNDFTGMLFEI